MTRFRFSTRPHHAVLAERVGANGTTGDGRIGVAPYHWLVVFAHGGQVILSDEEFMETFEPADESARNYLRSLG